MTAALFITIILALSCGLWLLDRRAAARLTAAIPALEKAAKSSTVAIATEFDLRLAMIVRGELEARGLLATATARLAGIETAFSLMPGAITSLRNLLDEKFKEWEERQIPPEGKEIGATALSRIRSVREQMAANEQASLEKFTQIAEDTKNFREPLIRVRAGD